METRALLTFMAAGLALLLTPGPAVLYIVTQSARGGFRAGFVSCLGLLTGGAVHLALAIVGLAMLLEASPGAFTFVKLAGAAYLGWLAVREVTRALRHQRPDAAGRDLDRAASLYRQGVLVNLLNPKAPLFFLAFLPQFIRPEAGPVSLQLATFGVLFLCMGLITDSSWAFVAARLGAAVRGRLGAGATRAGHWLAALVYGALALGAALSSRN